MSFPQHDARLVPSLFRFSRVWCKIDAFFVKHGSATSRQSSLGCGFFASILWIFQFDFNRFQGRASSWNSSARYQQDWWTRSTLCILLLGLFMANSYIPIWTNCNFRSWFFGIIAATWCSCCAIYFDHVCQNFSRFNVICVQLCAFLGDSIGLVVS